MRTTHFVVSMSEVNHKLHRSVENLASQIDMEQWIQAGIELGRTEELAERLAGLCRLAREAVLDEQHLRQTLAAEAAEDIEPENDA